MATATVQIILSFTELGRKMRAVSDSPQLARVSGIRVERVVYVLMDAIRSYLIKRTQLANTRGNTIRLKLLKRMNDRSRLSWPEFSCLLTLFICLK